MSGTNETTTRIDWPVVALIAVVGLIAIAALRVLGIEKADLAAMSAEQWTMVAGILGGFAGTLVVAFRGKVAERVPTGTTKPPPAPPSSGIGPAAALLLAVAIAIPNVGCGASALSAHARASSVLTVAIEGADHLADVGGEVAMAACESLECTQDVEDAIEAIDAGVATVAVPIAAYVQAVEMAVAGGEDPDVLSALGAVLLRALEAWDDLVPLYAPLGVELPQLPRSVHLLFELVVAVAGASS